MSKALEKLLKRLHESDPERMARAAEQGYDTDKVYLHGTASDIKRFSPQESETRNFWNEGEAGNDYGFNFLTDSPLNASEYAKAASQIRDPDYMDLLEEDLFGEGANVVPAFTKKPKVSVDAKGQQYDYVYPRNFKKHGETSYLFKNVYDSGSPTGTEEISDVVAISDPSDIRSIFAKFDPAKKDSSDILASAAPYLAATGVGAAALSPEEAEASVASKQLQKLIDSGIEAVSSPKQRDIVAMAKDSPNKSKSPTARWASTVNCGTPCSRMSASRSGHTA